MYINILTYFLDVHLDEIFTAPNPKDAQYVKTETKHSLVCEPGRYKFVIYNNTLTGSSVIHSVMQRNNANFDKSDVPARKSKEIIITIHPNQISENINILLKTDAKLGAPYKLQVFKIYSVVYTRHGMLNNEYNLYSTTIPPGQYRCRLISENKIPLSINVEIGGNKDKSSSITEKPFLSKIMLLHTKDEKLFDGKAKVQLKVQNSTSKEGRFELNLLQGYGYEEIKEIEDGEKNTEKISLVTMIDDFYSKRDIENINLIVDVAKSKDFVSVQNYGIQKTLVIQKNLTLKKEFEECEINLKKYRELLDKIRVFVNDHSEFSFEKEVKELEWNIEGLEADRNLIEEFENEIKKINLKNLEKVFDKYRDLCKKYTKICPTKELTDVYNKVKPTLEKLKIIDGKVKKMDQLCKNQEDYRPIADLVDEIEESEFGKLYEEDLKYAKTQSIHLQKKEQILEELNDLIQELTVNDGTKLSSFLFENRKFISEKDHKRATDHFKNLEKKKEQEKELKLKEPVVEKRKTRDYTVLKSFQEMQAELLKNPDTPRAPDTVVSTPTTPSFDPNQIDPQMCKLNPWNGFNGKVKTQLDFTLTACNKKGDLVQFDVKDTFEIKVLKSPQGYFPQITTDTEGEALGTVTIMFNADQPFDYIFGIYFEGKEIFASPFSVSIEGPPKSGTQVPQENPEPNQVKDEVKIEPKQVKEEPKQEITTNEEVPKVKVDEHPVQEEIQNLHRMESFGQRKRRPGVIGVVKEAPKIEEKEIIDQNTNKDLKPDIEKKDPVIVLKVLGKPEPIQEKIIKEKKVEKFDEDLGSPFKEEAKLPKEVKEKVRPKSIIENKVQLPKIIVPTEMKIKNDTNKEVENMNNTKKELKMIEESGLKTLENPNVVIVKIEKPKPDVKEEKILQREENPVLDHKEDIIKKDIQIPVEIQPKVQEIQKEDLPKEVKIVNEEKKSPLKEELIKSNQIDIKPPPIPSREEKPKEPVIPPRESKPKEKKPLPEKIVKLMEKTKEERNLEDYVNRMVNKRKHESSHELLNIFHQNLIKVIYGNQSTEITRKSAFSKSLVDSIISILNYKKTTKFFWQERSILEIFQYLYFEPIQKAMEFFNSKNISQITKYQDPSISWVQFILETGDFISFVQMLLSNQEYLESCYEKDSIMVHEDYRDDLLCNLELLGQLKFKLGYIPNQVTKEMMETIAKKELHQLKVLSKTIMKYYLIKKKEKVNLLKIGDDFSEKNVIGDLIRTKFVPCLENICSNGIKIKNLEGFWSIWEITDILAPKSNDFFLKRSCLMLRSFPVSDSMKFQCLICLALNNQVLNVVLETIFTSETIQKYYEKESLWYNSETIKEIMEYSVGISKLPFKIDLNKLMQKEEYNVK